MRALFRCGLAAFWTCWYTLVAGSNGCEALQAWGVLPEAWSWTSGNLAAIRQATGVTDPQAWLPSGLLLAATLAEGGLGLAFARAWRGQQTRLEGALMAGCALWGCFLIADEFCAFYLSAGTHMGLLLAHLLGLIYLQGPSSQRAF